MPPTKSPMSISAISGRPCSFCTAASEVVAGGAGDMREARRAGDVDAAMDRMDPGRAGIGHDDAGGAEDRQAADDAEPAVEGLLRQGLAARDRDLDARRRRARLSERRGFGDGVAHHLARHGIDRGLARRQPAGPARVTVPTPSPGAKGDAGCRARRRARVASDQGAVGHVRIVAGILDRRRPVAVAASVRSTGEREGRRSPRGSVTSTGSGNVAREQRRDRQPWRPPWRRRRSSSRAGAGRLAVLMSMRRRALLAASRSQPVRRCTAWNSRDALRGAFRCSSPGMSGSCGAGPGDPGLLTLRRAHRPRASADVIVHDALVDARVLALARPGAARISPASAAASRRRRSATSPSA